MKNITCAFFAILMVLSSQAQNKFQLSFAQTGKDFNQLNSVKRVSDGYILVGCSGSSTSPQVDLLVMKTDFGMNPVWSKVIGTTAEDKIEYFSKCVVFESDGMVILANTTQPGTRDFLLTKIDYSGSVLWAKSYGLPISSSSYNDNAAALCKTSNGYYLCGYLVTATTGYGLVIKVDNSGVQQWAKSFIPQSGVNSVLWSAATLTGDDLVVGGSYGSGATDAYLIKISSAGNLVWQKKFVKSNYDDFYALTEDHDGSILCVLKHDGYFSAARGALLNVNALNGDINWAKNYDLDNVNDRDGQMCNVMKNADHTTMITFIYSNLSAGTFKFDIALVKLDAGGSVVWAKKYGTPYSDTWPKVFQNDNGYLICSEQADNRYASDHFYILGINSDGSTGCNESTLNPTVTALSGHQWLDFNTTLQAVTPTVNSQTLTSTSPSDITKTVMCINTGVASNKLKNNTFTIFPNPAYTELHITSPVTIHKVEIFNSIGQLVYTENEKSLVNIETLPGGAYEIRINGEFSHKFIKE